MFETFFAQLDEAFATVGNNKKKLAEQQAVLDRLKDQINDYTNTVSEINAMMELTNNKVDTLASEINGLINDVTVRLKEITDKNYLELKN